MRNELSLYACTVLAYSSDGGIVLKSLTGVELDYLGLPRTKPMSGYEDSAELDVFARSYCNLACAGGRTLTSTNVIPA
jgi:hypothetical protein